MQVTIRPATPSDADAVTALAFAAKRHWGYPDAWLDAWRDALSVTVDYIATNVVFCAEDATARVIGFYALERDGSRLQLGHLWLEPALIGQGVGRQLLEHAAQTAQSLGATELLIEADPNAEGFYLHMGARRVGEIVSRLTGTDRVLPQLTYPLLNAAPEA
jgi:GNAT superfamily N-acetyltransferase